jgi:hypothetical protein
MDAVWLVAAVVVVAAVVAVVRWVAARGKRSADVDMGSVSESWLAEQRRKDS